MEVTNYLLTGMILQVGACFRMLARQHHNDGLTFVMGDPFVGGLPKGPFTVEIILFICMKGIKNKPLMIHWFSSV